MVCEFLIQLLWHAIMMLAFLIEEAYVGISTIICILYWILHNMIWRKFFVMHYSIVMGIGENRKKVGRIVLHTWILYPINYSVPQTWAEKQVNKIILMECASTWHFHHVAQNYIKYFYNNMKTATNIFINITIHFNAKIIRMQYRQ